MNDDDAKDEPVPWDLIAPLVAWMVKHHVMRVHVVATLAPTPQSEEPARDETVHLLYCDEEPTSRGLLDVYIVADENGYGRINGPTNVPQHVLRPILRALDDASVSELLIATNEADREDPQSAVSDPATITTTRSMDIEEHEVPSLDSWPSPFLAVQVRDKAADV